MKTRHLLRLLDAELLDAEEDIRDLELTLSRRFSAMEITAYVYQENNAVLEAELHGIERVRAHIAALDAEAFADLDELASHIHSWLREEIDHHGTPGAVESIVRRRLTRLMPFVRPCDDA